MGYREERESLEHTLRTSGELEADGWWEWLGVVGLREDVEAGRVRERRVGLRRAVARWIETLWWKVAWRRWKAQRKLDDVRRLDRIGEAVKKGLDRKGGREQGGRVASG